MWLMRIFLRKYPALLRVLEKRHAMYNETVQYIEEQAAAGKIFLFRPEEPLPIGRICHDPERLQQTYDIGRALAEKHLQDLKTFLQR